MVRPIVLSIAGFDPSGGAGLLADIKTIEQCQAYGLGISTAQTLQTEYTFSSIRWEEENQVLNSVNAMLQSYPVAAVKIGITPSPDLLEKLVSMIDKKNEGIKIVWDPVIVSSTGFSFWGHFNEQTVFRALSKIYLTTPNYHEVTQLVSFGVDAKSQAAKLSACCHVLLKGGHNEDEPGIDYLYSKNGVETLSPRMSEIYPKHGSGCVLSAAI
ncbi:MAG: bifunctional hydroxymethylpyrimidine kinase/phosphomethylpyrimidine kinase, partial [Bacteroidota bacterium]